MTFTAGPDDDNRRLDRILRRLFPAMPLSGVYRLLRKNRVLVDNCAAAADTRVRDGAVISVPDTAAARGVVPPKASGTAASPAGVPPMSVPAKHPLQAPKEKKEKLDIIFENSDLLAVNKPVGIAVHGEGSLDTLVQAYLEGRREAAPPDSLSFRSGPLHRLDQPTSGIVVFSKTLAGARLFSSLIQEHRLVKRYLALVDGCLDRPEMWEDALLRDKAARKTFAAGGAAGNAASDAASAAVNTVQDTVAAFVPLPAKAAAQWAEARITPLEVTARHSLICAEIGTGRTHQIRAQAALHGHPLSGDKKYNGSFQKGGLLLHAWTLDFPQEAGIPPLAAPLPEAFQQRIRGLFGENIRLSG